MQNALTPIQRRFILGFGVTGQSCARYFSRHGLAYSVIDTVMAAEKAADLSSLFLADEWYVGNACQSMTFSSSDLLVVSPGIALSHPIVIDALAAGAQITSDIELFNDQVTQPVIAVTGSNGKTTTVHLITHILKQQGLRVALLGNVGEPVLDMLDSSAEAVDVVVLELSSFQLERISDLKANVACILNVTPDHLDRHPSFADYAKAKRRIYQGATYQVFHYEDAETYPDTPTQTLSFGFDSGDITLTADCIQVKGLALLNLSDIPLKGKHNALNVMAALACCQRFGVDYPAQIDAIRTFTGLPDRCEWCDRIDGVTYINDSKGTNVGATLSALEGLSANKNILLIAGGEDKGLDYQPLSNALHAFAKELILLGECAPKIAESVTMPATFVSTLDEAVHLAHQMAEPSDVVLLSPASASFDMFDNYHQRGQVFKAAVKRLKEARL
ncbi:MAG: UDP-N-acetylmuramoyl-L-alanine--D-glutamate ligase [Cellvibrionales bacterium]|nr:UDP-N-acetylmuramoyl-L-alanine--D-glutamate ligase [Cellvibrionales bacterium]